VVAGADEVVEELFEKLEEEVDAVFRRVEVLKTVS
jgi:hypothetical protein